jgi:hypothetical protein
LIVLAPAGAPIGSDGPLKIAYLINGYPQRSQASIRREMVAAPPRSHTLRYFGPSFLVSVIEGTAGPDEPYISDPSKMEIVRYDQ